MLQKCEAFIFGVEVGFSHTMVVQNGRTSLKAKENFNNKQDKRM